RSARRTGSGRSRSARSSPLTFRQFVHAINTHEVLSTHKRRWANQPYSECRGHRNNKSRAGHDRRGQVVRFFIHLGGGRCRDHRSVRAVDERAEKSFASRGSTGATDVGLPAQKDYQGQGAPRSPGAVLANATPETWGFYAAFWAPLWVAMHSISFEER